MPTSFLIKIDGKSVEATADQSILDAARKLGLEIPTLCYLEKCGPLNTCSVCLVKLNGKLVPSCGTKAQPGMVVESDTHEVHEARRTALELLFSDHVGDCLSPCQRLCPLGLNIPVMLRHTQAGRLSEALEVIREALPLAGVLGRLCHHPCEQGCRRGLWDDPAGIRDVERFVTEQGEEMGTATGKDAVPRVPDPAQKMGTPRTASLLDVASLPVSGKAVVIIGAGPAGLAAAHYLARRGHTVTIVDRHEKAGGSLRTVGEADLPFAVLDRELELLKQMGVDFKLGVELGDHLTLEGLARGFDAILLTIGEVTPGDGERIGLTQAGTALQTDPNTCLTSVRKVFAAGAAVKPVKQLVRAMGEGRAAAECVTRFLEGRPVCRPEKAFSSVMGRLDPGELRQFLLGSNTGGSVSPCDRCAGFSGPEAATEAGRCLHCDCRSSGNCLLQHYARVYEADAGRFRAERRKFEQLVQPGGVIFEPGKCILCGICVRLTELAREPLGLTFIGRGFDVRVAAPLNHTIEEGLQRTAAECVHHCPTGALAFGEIEQKDLAQSSSSSSS